MGESINWRKELRQAIEEGFDLNDLQTLCFDLDINYEVLSGENLSAKVRELIELFERKNELPRLISQCKENRKNLPWDEIEAAVIEAAEAAARNEEAATTPVEAEESPVLPPTTPSQPPKLVLTPQTIAIAVIGILVVIVAIYLLVRTPQPETADLPAADTPAAETAVSVAAQPTEEPTQMATDVPPTSTKAPPTATDEPTPEPTVAPTIEPTIPPTIDAVVEVEPTVLYPDGTPLELIYDPTSFYLYNPSSERVRVSNLSFEALDDAGRPLIFGLAGERWTQFYSFVDGLSCDGIEPFGVGGTYLRPQFCRSYNATITPEANGVELFWIERSGAVEFRVLWDSEEIARCPLGTNTCVVRVPAP